MRDPELAGVRAANLQLAAVEVTFPESEGGLGIHWGAQRVSR